VQIGGNSADSGKNQFADAISATLVHFDTNQVGLPAQPVDTANTAFPASHNGAALLVRPRNLSLRLASVAQGFPFLRSDASEECGVDRIEYIQIRNNSPRDGGARVRALDLLIRR